MCLWQTIEAADAQPLRNNPVRITHNRCLETFLARADPNRLPAPYRRLKVNCGDFLKLITAISCGSGDQLQCGARCAGVTDPPPAGPPSRMIARNVTPPEGQQSRPRPRARATQGNRRRQVLVDASNDLTLYLLAQNVGRARDASGLDVGTKVDDSEHGHARVDVDHRPLPGSVRGSID